MADMLQNYIDGKFVDAADGTGFDVFNPATGEVIATAPAATWIGVPAAVVAMGILVSALLAVNIVTIARLPA
jgi:acyl-CoA reductase-like NAD-dependent aldehyde dehydrogenase